MTNPTLEAAVERMVRSQWLGRDFHTNPIYEEERVKMRPLAAAALAPPAAPVTEEGAREAAVAIVSDIEWQMSNFRPAKGESGASCQFRRSVDAITTGLLTFAARSSSERERRLVEALKRIAANRPSDPDTAQRVAKDALGGLNAY